MSNSRLKPLSKHIFKTIVYEGEISEPTIIKLFEKLPWIDNFSLFFPTKDHSKSIELCQKLKIISHYFKNLSFYEFISTVKSPFFQSFFNPGACVSGMSPSFGRSAFLFLLPSGKLIISGNNVLHMRYGFIPLFICEGEKKDQKGRKTTKERKTIYNLKMGRGKNLFGTPEKEIKEGKSEKRQIYPLPLDPADSKAVRAGSEGNANGDCSSGTSGSHVRKRRSSPLDAEEKSYRQELCGLERRLERLGFLKSDRRHGNRDAACTRKDERQGQGKDEEKDDERQETGSQREKEEVKAEERQRKDSVSKNSLDYPKQSEKERGERGMGRVSLVICGIGNNISTKNIECWKPIPVCSDDDTLSIFRHSHATEKVEIDERTEEGEE
ncbi:hypothetical protein ADUPG1_008526, partial [Aduncisulcus paluster]